MIKVFVFNGNVEPALRFVSKKMQMEGWVKKSRAQQKFTPNTLKRKLKREEAMKKRSRFRKNKRNYS